MEEKKTKKQLFTSSTQLIETAQHITKKRETTLFKGTESIEPLDIESELENLESDHLISERIYKSFINKFKMEEIFSSFEEFSNFYPSEAKLIESCQSDSEKKSLSEYQKVKVLVCLYAQFKLETPFFVIVTGRLTRHYFQKGDSITTLGRFETRCNCLVISALQKKPISFFELKMFIISPEMRVKVTNLTAKSQCMRANVLRSILAPIFESSVPALKGTIQHALFERVLLSQKPIDSDLVHKFIKEEMKRQIENILAVGLDYDDFEKQCVDAVYRMIKWKEDYLGPNRSALTITDNHMITLEDVIITEKSFSSDTFGLSGIVDAILSCKIVNKKKRDSAPLQAETKFISFPFELKTGQKESAEHEAQVLIYNYLMREENEDFDTGFGSVFYLNIDNKCVHVDIDHTHFYNLMENRNSIISKTKEIKRIFEDIFQYDLPPRSEDPYVCNFCEQKNTCITSAVLKKTYNDPQTLQALLRSDQQYDHTKKESVRHAFVDEESRSLAKPRIYPGSERCELDEIDLDEIELDYLKMNKNEILLKVKFPDLEDMFTEKEPKFRGFEDFFRPLSIPKLNYFAKWFDLILIEESYANKHANEEKLDEKSQQSTDLDFESYDELKIYLKEQKSERDLFLKFSYFFLSEIEASFFLEKICRGQSIYLKHKSTNIVLYGVVKSKSVRRKMIMTNEYYVMNLILQSKHSHVQNSFFSASGILNYDRITMGWEYYDPVYIFENKMRTNVTRLVTESELENLAEVVINGVKPDFTAALSEVDLEIMESCFKEFSLKAPQREAIMKSIKTENFNLILGSRWLIKECRAQAKHS